MSINTSVAVEKSSTEKAIMVVEDDINIGMFLVQAIEEEKQYQVLLATNGQEALTFMQKVKPNLFLLDQQLPSMSGLELYDLLQSIEGLKQTPVLFMSANPPIQELQKIGRAHV